MTLFQSSFIFGILMVILGFVCFTKSVASLRSGVQYFIRSQKWTLFFVILAAVSFIYQLSQLTEANFGEYKGHLMLLFGMVSLGAILYKQDFLIIRAWCALLLMASNFLLSTAYLEAEPLRVFFVSAVYAFIVLAIYLAAVPYRLRDFFEKSQKNPRFLRVISAVCLLYGLFLVLLAFLYTNSIF